MNLTSTYSYNIVCLVVGSPGRPAISAEKHMLTFLYFAGHETICYRAVADRFNVTLSTLFNIITRIVQFLLQLAPMVIALPTQRQKRITERFFRRTKRFPGVIGRCASISNPMS